MKIVVMTKTYQSLQPGEAAGFDEALADQLIAQGLAVSEADWEAEAEAADEAEAEAADEAEAEAEAKAKADAKGKR